MNNNNLAFAKSFIKDKNRDKIFNQFILLTGAMALTACNPDARPASQVQSPEISAAPAPPTISMEGNRAVMTMEQPGEINLSDPTSIAYTNPEPVDVIDTKDNPNNPIPQTPYPSPSPSSPNAPVLPTIRTEIRITADDIKNISETDIPTFISSGTNTVQDIGMVDLASRDIILVLDGELNETVRIHGLAPSTDALMDSANANTDGDNGVLWYKGEIFNLYRGNGALLAVNHGRELKDFEEKPIDNGITSLEFNDNNIYFGNSEAAMGEYLANNITAGSGNDFFHLGGGVSRIDGGAGVDIVSYRGYEESIRFVVQNLDPNGNPDLSLIYVARPSSTYDDEIKNVEIFRATGSQHNVLDFSQLKQGIYFDFGKQFNFHDIDSITGTNYADTFIDSFNNDIFLGGSGKDIFYLKAGSDIILDFTRGEDTIGFIESKKFIDTATNKDITLQEPIEVVLRKMILSNVIELSKSPFTSALDAIIIDFSNDNNNTIQTSIDGKTITARYVPQQPFTIIINPSEEFFGIENIDSTAGATTEEVNDIFDAFLLALGTEVQIQYYDI